MCLIKVVLERFNFKLLGQEYYLHEAIKKEHTVTEFLPQNQIQYTLFNNLQFIKLHKHSYQDVR